MELPKPERIKIENGDMPIEDIIDQKRDLLYPKLLEVIRYCQKHDTCDIPFLEIYTEEDSVIFKIPKVYNEQIENTIKYYIELEEYEICQELTTYLNYDS
jgi:hypothetical protein